MDFGKVGCRRVVFFVDHDVAHQRQYDLPVLVDAVRADLDDAGFGLRIRWTLFQHFALAVDRIADKDWVGEFDLLPAEVGYGVFADVGHAHADDQRQREGAVDQDLPPAGFFTVFGVEMQGVAVVG